MKNSWANTATKTSLGEAAGKLGSFMGINAKTQMPNDNVLTSFPTNQNNILSEPNTAPALEL